MKNVTMTVRTLAEIKDRLKVKAKFKKGGAHVDH